MFMYLLRYIVTEWGDTHEVQRPVMCRSMDEAKAYAEATWNRGVPAKWDNDPNGAHAPWTDPEFKDRCTCGCMDVGWTGFSIEKIAVV